MNTQTNNGYLLLFRGTEWYQGLSPEQMQQVADQWATWFARLTEKGVALSGNPLEHEGKIVSGNNGRIVADGPFAESKESIGGYFLLQVDSLDAAVAVAQECPGLAYGIRVEVRPVAGECAMLKTARTDAQPAEVVA